MARCRVLPCPHFLWRSFRPDRECPRPPNPSSRNQSTTVGKRGCDRQRWDRRRQRHVVRGSRWFRSDHPVQGPILGHRCGKHGGRRGCGHPLPSRDARHPIGWLMTLCQEPGPALRLASLRLTPRHLIGSELSRRVLWAGIVATCQLVSAPALRPFAGKSPAFSVLRIVTARKCKKEGSCGPDWTYVTSCSDCGMPGVSLISVRSVVQVHPGPLGFREFGEAMYVNYVC